MNGRYAAHSRLIDACVARGYRQMVAVIGEPTNTASIKLHERFGFELVGVFRGLGRKHGRWLDTVQMQRALGDGADDEGSEQGRTQREHSSQIAPVGAITAAGVLRQTPQLALQDDAAPVSARLLKEDFRPLQLLLPMF